MDPKGYAFGGVEGRSLRLASFTRLPWLRIADEHRPACNWALRQAIRAFPSAVDQRPKRVSYRPTLALTDMRAGLAGQAKRCFAGAARETGTLIPVGANAD
jgi:hypothetical protein